VANAPAKTRKLLDDLLRSADTRYVDLAVRLRRITADFAAEVPEGYVVSSGGVELRTLAAGRLDVPVVSCTRYASRTLADDAELLDEGGAAVGVLRAERVLEAGGRWDTVRRAYTKDAPQAPQVYDLMESQVDMARWFAAWLRRWQRRQGDPRRAKVRDIRSVLYYGNRAGGKTELCLWLTLAAAITVPDAITWIVSCSRPQSQEDVHERLGRIIPPEWGAYRGQPAYRWLLVNGSRIREMTGDSPEDLKQGRVDLAFLNEAAKMDKRAYAYPIGRISDMGGIMLMASNPPTVDVPKGAWVLDLFEQLKDREKLGKWCALHVVQADGALNASIDQGARDDVGDLLRMVSPEIATADADGAMRAIKPKLVYEYDRAIHGLKRAPELGDITERFTKDKQGRAYQYLAGVDFQQSPYIIVSYWKLYGSLAAPILWCVSDFTCQGSEDDFLDEALLSGVPTGDGQSDEIEPGNVLWIGDSSAQWQDRKNRGQQATILPPSFAFWKQRGLPIIPPTTKITPEAKWAKNPPKQVSYGQLNRLTKEGRMLISPLATVIGEAFRQCEARRREAGGVNAEPKWSHAIDTARYVAWWVDPVTRRKPAQQQRAAGAPLVYTL